MGLKVKDLYKNYGKIEALSGISFEVKPGEIYALVGPNGAGKSTTLKTISTLLKPNGGSIEVFGNDVIEDSHKVRKIISYLPEDAGAYKDLTGEYYFNFTASILADSNEEKSEFIERAKRFCKLGDRLKDKVKTYSKGMVRKLLLARALMNKPKLAIMDEPTSGLDVINAVTIRKLIKDFSQEGVMVLLSSHNMLEIEFLSDRLGIIYNGKIYVEGTSEELKKKYNAKNLEEVFAEVINE